MCRNFQKKSIQENWKSEDWKFEKKLENGKFVTWKIEKFETWKKVELENWKNETWKKFENWKLEKLKKNENLKKTDTKNLEKVWGRNKTSSKGWEWSIASLYRWYKIPM